MFENDNKISDLIQKIPLIPDTLRNILEVVKSQNASIQKISAIIESNKETEKIFLEIINSKYFSLGQEIKSVQKAIVLLGVMRAKNVILVVSIYSLYLKYNHKECFIHSLKCAMTAKILSEQNGIIEPNDAFLLGLLHDIGKIIIYEDSSLDIQKIQQNNDEFNIVEFENNNFGTNHCITGSMILKKWNMPPLIVDCVKYHHTPTLSSLPSVCGLIYASDTIIKENKETNSNMQLIERLGISIKDLKNLQLMVNTKSEMVTGVLKSDNSIQ